MEEAGKKKYKGGKGKPDYKYWTVTVNDVLQWIGVWMYFLAFPQHGGRESYFRPPKGGFGPKHELKQWLKIGCPQEEVAHSPSSAHQ